MELVVEIYKKTEVGLIPSDWEVKPLSDVVDFLDGQRRPIKSSERKAGEYPYYGASGIIDFVDNYIFDDDLILLGEDGENILSRNLPLAFKVSGKIWVNNHAHVLKPKEEIDITFLTDYLESLDYTLLNSGTAQPKLNKQVCLNIKVVFPTKAEQTAIATALSDADALISSLEKLIVKKHNIKQGSMQKLLQPKEGWEVKKLGDLTKVFTKQTGFDYTAYIKPSLVQYRTDDTIPFIQNKDFNNRWINFDTDYFIPRNIAIQFPKILLNEKSLLISISGSVGNIGLFDSKELAFIGGAVAILKFKDSDLIDWVMFYLKSVDGQKKLLDNVKAGSHQNLILDDIRKIEIVFPPKLEQTRIATILSDMDAEITAIETKLEKYKKVKLGMMQNLLTGKIRLV